MRSIIASAAACAALLSLAAPAVAQTVAPPAQPSAPASRAVTEQDRLGAQLWHIIFGAIDFNSVMAKQMGGMESQFSAIKSRPEWPELFRQAAVEELEHDMPQIELMLGRKLAAGFTVPELQAGVVFMGSPGVAAALMESAKAEGPKKPPPPEVRKAIERLMKTAAGRSFMEKLPKANTDFGSDSDEFIAMIAPGMMRRFGEKAEAAENARAAVR